MSGKYRSFAILVIILLAGSPSARALQCYQCRSDESDSCRSQPEQKELLTCEVPSSTESSTEATESSSWTTESDSSPSTTTESDGSPSTTTESDGSPSTTTESDGSPSTTTESASSSSTTTESTSSPSTTTESTSSPSTTTKSTSSPSTTTKKEVDVPDVPVKDPNDENKDSNKQPGTGDNVSYEVKMRERRSILINRFSRGETYEDKFYCFEDTIKADDKDVVHRGCTTDKNYCKNEGQGGNSCRVCEDDACNSVSSIDPTYMTVILSLVIAIFCTK